MRIACLLMAAGAGSRFGGCKQLALIDGKPLVRHSLETLASVFSEKVFIVLGAYREGIAPFVEDLAHVIDHVGWSKGLGSSIACGVSEIESQSNFDGILVALADQVQLTASDFEQLVDRFDGEHIVAACYAEGLGVPAIFPSVMFENLKRLEGDRGAKAILLELKQDVVAVSLPAATVDIDTVADIGR